MQDQLYEIGMRLAELRKICEVTTADMAKKLSVTEAEYISYEEGNSDFSFSFLYNAADFLGVDVIDILSGDSAKLTQCSVVKKGHGLEITRNKAYDYKHLAYTFRNLKAEPFLVTIDKNEDVPTLHSHDGQEFNYVLSGKIKFFIGSVSYILEEGDSVYFDSGIPHTLQTMDGKPSQFIAVVTK